ncbi:ABC transporter permease [Dactylosporangium vinaceum]|uniref:ABC transporter permease n=1 Tax=Dactylosporangium vinaceum TaxID=53362 RepID=A0ABV5M317_9ACTN|nr:ABC transporter permease [Dactylosporangium vinaceum]UAB99841.1 ABC transporter permease [Dactylosporangium vinaceum]
MRRRLAAVPLTLLGVSLLVFLATDVLPGDVGRTVLGREASAEAVAAYNRQLGLDDPVWLRYIHWLWHFITGDWGVSYTLREPVAGLVRDRLAASLTLALFAFVLLVPVAVGAGLAAGARHDTWLDRVISATGLALGATPEFVTGVVLLVVFAVQLHWFPVSARSEPGDGPLAVLARLFLPALSLVLLCTGYVARHVRASTIAVVGGGYVRAARLRGTPPGRILTRHVLRNATVPATSALGVQLQFLLGGLVVVELLFNYPGLGALLLQSAVDKDVPTLQATAMVLGLAYLAVTLLTDLTYRLLDPRVRFEVRA